MEKFFHITDESLAKIFSIYEVKERLKAAFPTFVFVDASTSAPLETKNTPEDGSKHAKSLLLESLRVLEEKQIKEVTTTNTNFSEHHYNPVEKKEKISSVASPNVNTENTQTAALSSSLLNRNTENTQTVAFLSSPNGNTENKQTVAFLSSPNGNTENTQTAVSSSSSSTSSSNAMLGVDDTKKELEQMSAEDVADKNASSILFYDTPAELLYLNRVFMNPHLFDQLKQPIALTFGDVTLLTSVHDWVPRMTLYRPAGLQSKLISVSHNQHAHIAELSSVVFMLKFADEHTKPSFCEKKAGAFLLGHVLSPLQELNPSVLSVMQKPKPNMPVSTVQKCTVLIHTTGRVGPNTRFLFQELVEL